MRRLTHIVTLALVGFTLALAFAPLHARAEEEQYYEIVEPTVDFVPDEGTEVIVEDAPDEGASDEGTPSEGTDAQATKKKKKEPPPPKEYVVHYDANGGEGSMDDSVFIEGNEAKLARCSFTRAGHTFEGWNTNADGSGTRLADAVDVRDLLSDNGLTVYAQWGSQIYVVRYTSGVPDKAESAVTGTMHSQLAVHDAPLELKQCEFERKGYKPLRWVDQNGTTHEFGEMGTNFESHTDTQSWELATISANPPDEGKDGHWSCQGSVVFEGKDGSLCAAMAFYFSNSAYSKGSLEDYDSIIKVVNLNTGEELKSARGIMLEHANDIAYRPDNGHFYVVQGGINEGFPDGVVELDENLNEVRSLTPEGTSHLWNISYSDGRFYCIGNVDGDSFARGNPNGETSDLIVLDEDLNLLETHTVDYSLQGFSGQGMVCDGSFLYSILVNFGEHESGSKQRLAVFTLEGEPRGTQRIDITSEVESASTLDGRMYFSTNGGSEGTIYGTNLAGATMSVVWEANPYRIEFDENDYPASGMPEAIDATYDEEVRLSEDAPTCPSMDFVAWNTKKDGSGESFRPGEIVHNLAESGTVTLYAQWHRTAVPFVCDNGSMTNKIEVAEPEPKPRSKPRHLRTNAVALAIAALYCLERGIRRRSPNAPFERCATTLPA